MLLQELLSSFSRISAEKRERKARRAEKRERKGEPYMLPAVVEMEDEMDDSDSHWTDLEEEDAETVPKKVKKKVPKSIIQISSKVK